VSAPKHISEEQRDALMGLFKERIKTINEVGSLQQEARNAQRNNTTEVYTNFSYTRNMNFVEERRKA
jgi:hypothetical protein